MHLFHFENLAWLAGIDIRKRRNWDFAGMWYPDRSLIALNHDLTADKERCVLAHELAHAALGHDCDDGPNERAADQWAANLLLTAEQVARCARIWPDNPEKWCEELEVTSDILKAWMEQPANYAQAERRLWLAS
ncbi:ImmA/IrrE family metallo-endopeptidase [Pseudoclavibacter terrae]|uniref:ImmA/IrrE family metallo-endopeptidase n=1 Tax=Pseudoclavibacter terrae TaxID=1530195 RepID=A0A7J5B6L9_9MICO|nr:ImmA/IrrE family metallo-endopeptidase [Pseudoclavibacter terrae]KAB1639836.1 ImmA/IrrE family metallo-endopeptidase [Pseudoclavibacter terrae]